MATRPAARALRVLITVAAVSLAAAVAARAVCRHITINITRSLPLGLYWITSDHDPDRGSIVVLFPPATIRELIAERHYLPTAVPLLKRVVALSGDTVCTASGHYVVAGVDLGPIATADSAGRPLPPPFPFCGPVSPGVAFVAGAGASSLDSRYFGPVPVSTLTVAVPLWTSS